MQKGALPRKGIESEAQTWDAARKRYQLLTKPLRCYTDFKTSRPTLIQSDTKSPFLASDRTSIQCKFSFGPCQFISTYHLIAAFIPWFHLKENPVKIIIQRKDLQ